MNSTPEHHHFADGVFRGKGSAETCQRCIMEHAAPMMYEALKGLYSHYRNTGGMDADTMVKWGYAAAALSAAEGKG